MEAGSDGYYLIELWGSQGWNPPPETDPDSQYGGRGAYVRGILEITEEEVTANGKEGQTLFVTVGIGTDPTKEGYGGGASDARWGANTLYDRIIVAAGGGGSHDRYNTDNKSNPGYSFGGYGGALTSGDASDGYGGQDGSGGSQTADGNAGGGTAHPGQGGAFGTGGDKDFTGESIGNGGYGYWGGGSGGYGYYNGGGGGGSSFISGYAGCVAITASGDTTAKTGADDEKAAHYSGKVFVPSVTIGGTEYTTVMIAGNAEMPAPDGGTEIGHSGGGYARVVYLGK